MKTKKNDSPKMEIQKSEIQKIEKPKREITPETLILAAVEKNVPIETLERLLALRDHFQYELAERAFREALAGFQGEIPVIKKSKTVCNRDGKIRYRYAPLDEIVSQVQPYLKKFNLSYDIDTGIMENTITVTVTVSHALGHKKTSSFSVPISSDDYMNEPQHYAAAQTYAKRYAFCNAFGILTGDEDDDTDSIPPQKRELKSEQKNNYAVAQEKLNQLPENIVQGFRVLGYGMRGAYVICEKNAWDNTAILRELNSIIDKKNSGV